MDFLHQKILDNSLLNILIVFAIIFVALVFKKILSTYAASLSYYLMNKNWKTIDRHQFSILFLKPLSWFIPVLIAIFAISKLNYPSVWMFKIYKIPFDVILEKIAIIIFIYSFFRLLFSIIDYVTLILSQRAKLTKDKSDDQLVVFFRDFFKVILGLCGILLVLKAAFNQNIGSLLTGLSIVGAALALSARESLENLIASFIIFFDKPFYVGDTLKVNTVTGTVERIGLRSTRIRTADKTMVTVPNKQMVDSVVDNWSMRTERRCEIKLDLSEKMKADEAAAFIEKIKLILQKNRAELTSHSVFLTDYTKNGSTITIEYFTPHISMAEFNKIKQGVNIALMLLVQNEHIELASAGNNITIFNTDTEAPPVSRPII